MLVVKMTNINSLNLQLATVLSGEHQTETRYHECWMNDESLLMTELVKDGKETRAIS